MFNKILLKVLKLFLNKESGLKLINYISNHFNINLKELVQNQIGILNYQNDLISGEKYFIETFLNNYFANNNTLDKLVLFDVGANIGKYASNLVNVFPKANIHAFEPNLKTYNILKARIKSNDNINLFPFGLSSTKCELQMTTYEENQQSSHTSLNSSIFTDFHKSNDITTFLAKFTTLDLHCLENKINHIDLLKIDTEGHELEVLKGAQRLLSEGKIKIIQFEFGECHVYTRVFLKDFYDTLVDYKFYRLLQNKLLPLGSHSPANEIFQFQNIIAIHD